MREIWHIGVCATNTPQTYTPKWFLHQWRHIKKQHRPSYHYLVDAGGVVHNLHPEDEVADCLKGFDAHTIWIAYIGGVDSRGRHLDNRTKEQVESLSVKIQDIKSRHQLAKIIGQCDFPFMKDNNPYFNVKNEYK